MIADSKIFVKMIATEFFIKTIADGRVVDKMTAYSRIMVKIIADSRNLKKMIHVTE